MANDSFNLFVSIFVSFSISGLKENVENLNYNIARVLALCKSYSAAMNKISLYARACINKYFVYHYVFSCVFRLFF